MKSEHRAAVTVLNKPAAQLSPAVGCIIAKFSYLGSIGGNPRTSTSSGNTTTTETEMQQGGPPVRPF